MHTRVSPQLNADGTLRSHLKELVPEVKDQDAWILAIYEQLANKVPSTIAHIARLLHIQFLIVGGSNLFTILLFERAGGRHTRPSPQTRSY